MCSNVIVYLHRDSSSSMLLLPVPSLQILLILVFQQCLVYSHSLMLYFLSLHFQYCIIFLYLIFISLPSVAPEFVHVLNCCYSITLLCNI